MLRGKLGKKAMAICLAASSVLLIACGGSTAQESGTPGFSDHPPASRAVLPGSPYPYRVPCPLPEKSHENIFLRPQPPPLKAFC